VVVRRAIPAVAAVLGLVVGAWSAAGPAARAASVEGRLVTRPAASDETGVRPPAVAGRFYPADPATLRRAVDTLLAHARPTVARDVIALVSPHAGYPFSGQIAADAFAYLKEARPDVVILLGANHTAPAVRGFAVHPGRAFRTPIGEVAIDGDLASALVRSGGGVVADAAPHREEHSIEVQLPFVQVLAPRARVVPVIVGTRDPGETARLGRTLAALLAGRRALVVASSDLSHYPAARDAIVVDRETLDAFAAFDATGLAARERQTQAATTPGLATRACGLGPALVAMSAARALGAARATVVSYANSGDTAVGDRDRVVGYGAVVYHRDAARSAPDAFEPASHPAAGPPSATEKHALLALARGTFTQFLESETLPLPRDVPPESNGRCQGAFVTLKEGGQLRGCIGRVVHTGPLPQLVSTVAFEAAFRDARFRPLSRQELDRVEVEISLLTPPRPVGSARDIVVGRDGVILRKGGRSAVFLPQVATERHWSRDQMLDELCVKGGLPRQCWTAGAELATFQADVFGEAGHR
jgi:hypothetical protein